MPGGMGSTFTCSTSAASNVSWRVEVGEKLGPSSADGAPGAMKRYIVNLTDVEQAKLLKITASGRHSARRILHANILLKSDTGLTDEEIVEQTGASVRTVERVRERCAVEGLDAALDPKVAVRSPVKVDGVVEAQLVRLVCSSPPDGRARWTLRLLADKVVELKIVDAISHETVRSVLKKTNSSRGRRRDSAFLPKKTRHSFKQWRTS
jgi:transposase